VFLFEILAGILLADLASSFVHWGQDNLGSKDTPLVGYIIEAGAGHHEDPEKFLHSSFWYRSRDALIGSAIVLILGLLTIGPSVFLFSLCAAGAYMIEIQVWARTQKRPLWVRILQKIGLFQSPEQHEKHHSVDDTQTYAIITSWLNPWLDKSGIWTYLARYKS